MCLFHLYLHLLEKLHCVYALLLPTWGFSNKHQFYEMKGGTSSFQQPLKTFRGDGGLHFGAHSPNCDQIYSFEGLADWMSHCGEKLVAIIYGNLGIY